MSAGGVYITDNYSEPMAPQHNFANNFDLDDPNQAMSVYARIMHEHTKKQLKTATNSARRRSEGVSPSESTASSESVRSTES
ncbi:hypothetical protein DPSP01_004100 [Paraphaeosphaeria sporulosa]|uniref:Uncharacterized protein n=1 Tax=Paraphaeosphaeria sporulosa TaxID=1460663 RepID=A0A177CDB4_9PLEO|nr:uncharacterized protein CC84DRAFT_1260023 [Paraphaeosphaeria sporulosa]OAG04690.1 hypothetical protein CC84DRAFT_1260023 [Paraphaeosphaeria sporulosa]